ncbi:hypothetical protein [Tumebacillus flagellatus]|uniref:hypothetical protein n=1 Tax=Tumebacillus flagellatus TaxID=1157490 RepID=UPI001268A72F|nr:hypothetical protein [Tumebacillus flagellatus]
MYTVYVSTERPQDQATLHIDQYSGQVLADLRYKDYGMTAKLISLGVVGLSSTGVILWWERKPASKVGAPAWPASYKVPKGILVLVILLGVLFPLAGASMLVVLVLEQVLRKAKSISRAKAT